MPESLPMLLQLPPSVLKEALDIAPNLRQALLDFVAKTGKKVTKAIQQVLDDADGSSGSSSSAASESTGSSSEGVSSSSASAEWGLSLSLLCVIFFFAWINKLYEYAKQCL